MEICARTIGRSPLLRNATARGAYRDRLRRNPRRGPRITRRTRRVRLDQRCNGSRKPRSRDGGTQIPRAGSVRSGFQTASAADRGGWKMGSGRRIGRRSSDPAGNADRPERRGGLQAVTEAHNSDRASKAPAGAAWGTPGIPEQAAPVQGPRSCGERFGATGRPASAFSSASSDSMIAACWALDARVATSCKQVARAVEDEASTIVIAAKTAPARSANHRTRARDLIIVLDSSYDSPSGESEA